MKLTAKQLALAVAETVAETGATIIEGHLYARLMGMCDLDTFNAAVGALKQENLITVQNHEIKATDELVEIYAKMKARA